DFVRPAEQRREVAVDLGLDGRHLAEHDGAGRAVDRDVVPLGDDLAVDGDLLAVVVDLQGGAADDGGLAHAAGDDRGVRGHPAAGGEHRTGGQHAVEVLGRGLQSHQDDV